MRISKVAVELDNSYLKLYKLMLLGYDTVQWLTAYEGSTEPCPMCTELERLYNGNGGIFLPAFLGFKVVRHMQLNENNETVPVYNENGLEDVDFVKEVEIYKNAPIYNHSHVGCRCAVLVTRQAPLGPNYQGPVFDPQFITVKG